MIIKVEVAIGAELYPVVVLGGDFCNECYVELSPVGRNSILYDMSYKTSNKTIRMCECITPECACKIPQLEYTHKVYEALTNA